MKTTPEKIRERFQHAYSISLSDKEIEKLLLFPNIETDLQEIDSLFDISLLHILKSLDLMNSLSFAKQYSSLQQIITLKGLSKDYLTLLFQRMESCTINNLIIKNSDDLNVFFDLLQCLGSHLRLALIQKRLELTAQERKHIRQWLNEPSLFQYQQLMRFRELIPRENRQAFIDSYAQYKLQYSGSNDYIIENLSPNLRATFLLNNFKHINAFKFPYILELLPQADWLQTAEKYISLTTIDGKDVSSLFEPGKKLSLSEFKRTLDYFPNTDEQDRLISAFFISLTFNPAIYLESIKFCVNSGALSQKFISDALSSAVFGDGAESFNLIIDFLNYLEEAFQVDFLNHIMHVTNNIDPTVRILGALKGNNKLLFLERINLSIYKDINQEYFLAILDFTPVQYRYQLIIEYINIVTENFKSPSDYTHIFNTLAEEHKPNFEELLQLYSLPEEKSYCSIM